MRTRRMPAFLTISALALVFVVLPLVGWFARTWTDYLWFADLGQSKVFVTRIVSELVIGVVFGVIAFALLLGNMLVARRMAPSVPVEDEPHVATRFDSLTDLIVRVRSRFAVWRDRAIPLVGAWFAFVSALEIARQWETIRLALARVPFGTVDAQFGRDLGFFVFTLPMLDVVSNWVSGTLVLATILTALVHLLGGSISVGPEGIRFAPHVKAHLSVLLASIVGMRAFAYWLAIYNLDFSQRGQVAGASYTDVYAQMPAYWILIGISLLTAGALLLNIRYRGWRLPVVALAAWIGLSILVGSAYPALVQQFRVSPNEAALEAPYIERNIRATRAAFGLTDVEAKPFAAREDLSIRDVVESSQTLDNVRLWDPSIVKQGYSQLQSIRSYYDFPDVDVDRYDVGGRTAQVLVSARELNASLLDAKAQNWVNTHLVYTHGFGLVMSPVNQADSRGLPRFVVGDIPPAVASSVASGAAASILRTDQPRIYFGEDTDPYVIVDTGKDEFDYPKGSTNAYYHYEGAGGPKIGGLARRLAWAIRLRSSQVLLSNYVTSDSRVLMYRDIVARVQKLAPWLTLENDPYPVLVDGRITWIIDGYTASDHYPYAQGLDDGTNYLRNSVKVTIDAYTGATTVYAFDPEEPVLKAWSSIFPTLIKSANDIPAGIAAHFRYPQGLFEAQAEVYRTYHMTNVNVFYNKEDQWQLPGERQGKIMEPFFVLLKLPGEAEEHFYLMQPYTPRNRDNMIGWMAASCDPDNYGKRTVYQFPKERVVLGPEQVTARINQDPVVSPQLSLWNQRGSSVLFGNMLVVPIRDSVVYIQPLFLQAEKTAIPELTRIVVVYADKVVMANSLTSALAGVFGTAAPDAGSSETTSTTGGSGSEPATVTWAEASQLYGKAMAAQKAGDWSAYGTYIKQLGDVIERLASDGQ